MNITEIFKKCEALTMSKRHDYTSAEDNHENFKRSAELASWFKSDEDKPYVILIGTKLARLGSLLDSKEPKNESIDDTFLDLINYCALWFERRSEITSKKKCDSLFVSVKCQGNTIKCKLHAGHVRTHMGGPYDEIWNY